MSTLLSNRQRCSQFMAGQFRRYVQAKPVRKPGRMSRRNTRGGTRRKTAAQRAAARISQ